LLKLQTVKTGTIRIKKARSSGEIIAITGGKGGTGKSVISVNLAISACKQNYKVLLVDGDIVFGNLNMILGMKPKYTLTDALKHGVNLRDIIVKGPGNVDILPASDFSYDIINSEAHLLNRLSEIFAEFQHDYDVVMIDTGSGLTQGILSFLLGVDKVIVVATPDPASISNAYSIIKIIKKQDGKIPVYLLVNMVSSWDEGDAIHKKINLMVNRFLKSNINFAGSLFRDESISASVKAQIPFVISHWNSASSNTIRTINRKILNPNNKKHAENPITLDLCMSGKELKFDWEL